MGAMHTCKVWDAHACDWDSEQPRTQMSCSIQSNMYLICRDAMAEAQEEDTPLKQKLDEFGTFLSKVPGLPVF